jgi:hypothetical protein
MRSFMHEQVHQNMRAFRWEDLDHSLVRLRLADLSEELRAQSKMQEKRIEFENRGNFNKSAVPYNELGFEDRRTGKPKQAWVTLRTLAEQRGLIRQPTKEHPRWSVVEKRMQEIRKILRKQFQIKSDPIPFVAGAGYQALFKISCRPSYHS